MKNYAYVVSEGNRSVTDFNFTNKTVCTLGKCENGDFAPDLIYSWDESNATHDFSSFYATIEELTKDFGEDDIIISSDLRLPDICEMLGNPEYRNWIMSYDVFSKMLRAYSELTETETISLEDLIREMQP